jgi:hypothetical protein
MSTMPAPRLPRLPLEPPPRLADVFAVDCPGSRRTVLVGIDADVAGTEGPSPVVAGLSAANDAVLRWETPAGARPHALQ